MIANTEISYAQISDLPFLIASNAGLEPSSLAALHAVLRTFQITEAPFPIDFFDAAPWNESFMADDIEKLFEQSILTVCKDPEAATISVNLGINSPVKRLQTIGDIFSVPSLS